MQETEDMRYLCNLKFKVRHSVAFKFGIRYLVLVIGFAFVYWFCFLCNTTSFLLSEELNSRVGHTNISDPCALAEFKKSTRCDYPFTIDNLNERIRPKIDSLELLNIRVSELESQSVNNSLLLDSMMNVAEKERADAIESFKKEKVATIQSSIDSLMEYMQGRDSISLILNGKYVELSELKYEYAVKYANACGDVLKNYGSFLPAALADSIHFINNQKIDAECAILRLQHKRLEISDDVKCSIIEFKENRLESTSYWTFLYYSVCTSTSCSFGDMAPNTWFTRLLSCLELIICIVLIALFIESIKAKNGGGVRR